MTSGTRAQTTSGPSYEQTVSAWAAHLRAGGTTPWSAWRSTADAELRDLPVFRPVPDAIHLELVRRINLAAGHGGSPAGLADRVLATAAPGRGLLDVPLPWPADPRRFGTPAHDPSDLPAEELVRLSVGVLAHLLPRLPAPPPERLPTRWPAPWRRRFRLHGSPSTAAALRRSLLARGHVETSWRPTHLVIARPVEVMMAEHWSDAVRHGGILKWSTTWRRAQASRRLPAPIDVAAIADSLHGRRHEPVHVVVARDGEQVGALVADVLRTRPVELGSGGDAARSDLLRRLNRLTALTHGPGQVGRLSRTLVALLEDSTPGHGDSAPVTPPTSLDWAREVAATTADDLRRAGYAVHGDPEALAPTEHRRPGTVDREHTLELAMMACLRTWHLGGTP
jgi:hypothetical protein